MAMAGIAPGGHQFRIEKFEATIKGTKETVAAIAFATLNGSP